MLSPQGSCVTNYHISRPPHVESVTQRDGLFCLDAKVLKGQMTHKGNMAPVVLEAGTQHMQPFDTDIEDDRHEKEGEPLGEVVPQLQKPEAVPARVPQKPSYIERETHKLTHLLAVCTGGGGGGSTTYAEPARGRRDQGDPHSADRQGERNLCAYGHGVPAVGRRELGSAS